MPAFARLVLGKLCWSCVRSLGMRSPRADGSMPAGKGLVAWLLDYNGNGVLADRINALGVIETYTAASCVLAADAAAKAGEVSLLDLRLSAGLGGKAFVVMTGEVSAVQSSVDAGAANVTDGGPVVSKIVIPSPSEDLKRQLL